MKNISIITIILFALVFSGCQKFLDVTPEDKLTQQQVMESEYAIQTVLNGIYLNMGETSTYGSNLTMSVLECMAQRYANDNDKLTYMYFSGYNFTEKTPQATLTDIWTGLYVQALACNDFLKILDLTAVVPENRKNIMRGEVLGLRAFYHFDILRLWGPVYTEDATTPCIPYNDVETGSLLPLLSSEEIVDKILADLKAAEELLKNDNIITQGVVETITLDPIRDFYTNRHYRMNYYAVKAMQARVYHWKGDTDSAVSAAKAVVEAPLVQSGRLFPWVRPTAIQVGYNPDRVFSTEVIFGIRNNNMYAVYDRIFAPTLSQTSELCPLAYRLQNTYENNDNDYRYYYLWKAGGGDKNYRTFYKYAEPNMRNNNNFPIVAEFFLPLIRISEMYYILAECEGGAIGLDYLNDVRTHRGLMPLTDASTLGLEIRKEYEKEFFGEGQLYYYYKRTGVKTLPSGITQTGTVAMATQLPLPESELSAR